MEIDFLAYRSVIFTHDTKEWKTIRPRKKNLSYFTEKMSLVINNRTIIECKKNTEKTLSGRLLRVHYFFLSLMCALEIKSALKQKWRYDRMNTITWSSFLSLIATSSTVCHKEFMHKFLIMFFLLFFLLYIFTIARYI